MTILTWRCTACGSIAECLWRQITTVHPFPVVACHSKREWRAVSYFERGKGWRAAPHSRIGFVAEGQCSHNAAWGLVLPCAEALSSAFQLSASPAALPNQNLSHCAPVLTRRAVWVVVVFPASLNCQTWLFGKLLRSNFLYDGEKFLWLHIIARTYLLWHELKSFIH